MKNLPWFCICVMTVVTPLQPSVAGESSDWSVHINGWDTFIGTYEKYKEAIRQYDSATQSVAWVSRRLASIDKENSFKNADDLKIGEFEEMEEFRARVEKQRRQDERLRQDERTKIEKQKQQYMTEADLYLHDSKELSHCVSAFTNRLQHAYLKINVKDLPYFDRDSMSFKDIRNPFYMGKYDWGAETRKIKFVVNAEKNDFDSVPMSKDAHKFRGSKIGGLDGQWDYRHDGCDSFTYWLNKTHRKLNVGVAKNISLKFSNLSDAGKFKNGVSSGAIKVWFCCEFKVGVPTDWIIAQGHYVRERWKNPAIGVLNALKYGVDDDTYYLSSAIWHPAVIGKMVPIKIISSKIIVEGESVRSMGIEVVSPIGNWSLER